MMSSKIKLSIDRQVEKMKSSGIKFNIISEEKAKEFISNNTYYFKIKAFQKIIQKTVTKSMLIWNLHICRIFQRSI